MLERALSERLTTTEELSYDCPEGGSPRAGGDGVGVGVGAREPQGG